VSPRQDPIGIGLVGAGWMGATLLARFAERDDVAVRAVCQPDPDGARRALAAVGLPAGLWQPDYDALLADLAVDAVVVCSPNALHGRQAIAALEAGKHVLCEKPCATQEAEFRRQVELERANPRLVTMVDYILWFDDLERELRRLVAARAFGTVTQFQVNYRHPVNVEGRKAWKLRRELVGDALGMGIVHALWAIVHAMAPQSRPAGVFATAAPALVRPFEVEPIWTIQIEFEDGATGVCLGNIESGTGYDAFHGVFGTEGAFVFDALVERPRKVRYRSKSLTGDRWVAPLDRARCEQQGFGALAWPSDASTPDSGDVLHHRTAAAVGHFVDCIKDGSRSPLGFGATAEVAELCFAALTSAAERRFVRLPLQDA
jgi:predicted dehydrogenase